MTGIRLRRGLRMFAMLAPMCCAAATSAAEPAVTRHSGFLGSEAVYEKLETVPIGAGLSAQRWFDRQMGTGYFARVLVDEVMFYPEPRPGPRLGAQTLQEARAYLSGTLRAAIGEVLPLASGTGPQVLRMQTAITGVSTGAPAGNAHPVAALFGGARANGVRVCVEVRFHDGETGALIGLALRELSGRPLAGAEQALDLQAMRAGLDRAAADAAATLAMMLSAPPAAR